MKKIHFITMALMVLTGACKRGGKDTPAPVERIPVADFNWKGEQQAPAAITFLNQSQDADTYHWDFGNGQTSELKDPWPVTYDQTGLYEVLLRATRGERSVLVKKRIGIAATVEPVARFSYSFANRQSVAPVGLILANESVNATAFVWEVNGIRYVARTPAVIALKNAGDYLVRLTAFQGTKTSVYEQTVTVAANSAPTAYFQLAYHPYPYSVGEEIQFVNESVNSDSWEWDFGNGGPVASTAEHPFVKFTRAGTFTISLVAKKGAARSAPASINLKIGQ